MKRRRETSPRSRTHTPQFRLVSSVHTMSTPHLHKSSLSYGRGLVWSARRSNPACFAACICPRLPSTHGTPITATWSCPPTLGLLRFFFFIPIQRASIFDWAYYNMMDGWIYLLLLLDSSFTRAFVWIFQMVPCLERAVVWHVNLQSSRQIQLNLTLSMRKRIYSGQK